jgi:hypothetical protein
MLRAEHLSRRSERNRFAAIDSVPEQTAAAQVSGERSHPRERREKADGRLQNKKDNRDRSKAASGEEYEVRYLEREGITTQEAKTLIRRHGNDRKMIAEAVKKPKVRADENQGTDDRDEHSHQEASALIAWSGRLGMRKLQSCARSA